MPRKRKGITSCGAFTVGAVVGGGRSRAAAVAGQGRAHVVVGQGLGRNRKAAPGRTTWPAGIARRYPTITELYQFPQPAVRRAGSGE